MQFLRFDGTNINEYPIYLNVMQERFPDIDFFNITDSEMPEGYFRVLTTGVIDPNFLSDYIEGMPSFDTNDNIFKQIWTEVPATGTEREKRIQSMALTARNQRNMKLRHSDSLVAVDRWEMYTEEEKNKIRTYRQALRDVTSQEGFPLTVIWPTL